MTYNELIQALRCCGNDDCYNCPAEPLDPRCVGEVRWGAVADRLEALLAENEHLREVTKMIGKDKNVPTSTEGGGVMGWKRCDPMARAKCPDRKLCELDATFADGSECDKFNEKCLGEAPTVADHIRAMSDFELMQFLWKLDSQDLGNIIKFCGKSHVCDELDVDEITEGMCQRCLLAQIQQPYESPTGQKG